MPDITSLTAAATRLSSRTDEALELLLGMRAQAIEGNASLGNDLDFDPQYDGNVMGPMADVTALAKRILRRWNKELHRIVCGAKAEDKAVRDQVLTALKVGAGAGAISVALTTLAVPAGLAVVLAPLIMKRFIVPASEEMCAVWQERLNKDV
jgi:hypothetical protein